MAMEIAMPSEIETLKRRVQGSGCRDAAKLLVALTDPAARF